MKNITDLRNELADVFAKLKSGQIAAKDATEINNCAGKMIQTCKVELEYFSLREEIPEIKFLEGAKVGPKAGRNY